MAENDLFAQPVDRSDLASFLRTPKLIRAFENLFKDVTQGLPDAAAQAQLTANLALALSEAITLGVFGQRPQRSADVRTGEGLVLIRDAAGVTLSLDVAFLVGAVLAYLPKQQVPRIDAAQLASAVAAFLPRHSGGGRMPSASDANSIIANRVFGKR